MALHVLAHGLRIDTHVQPHWQHAMLPPGVSIGARLALRSTLASVAALTAWTTHAPAAVAQVLLGVCS